MKPIQEAGRSGPGGSERSLLRNGLLVAQVSLSFILLIGSGLMMRALIKVQSVDPRFRTNHLLTMRIPLPEQRYQDREKRNLFFQELLERVSSVPGVQTVGLNTSVHPLGNISTTVEVIGNNRPNTQPVIINQINSDYLKALDISLLEGRVFDKNEVDTNKHVAIVNRRFVQSRLDSNNKLGQVIRIPMLKRPPLSLEDNSFQIIGIVEDTLNRGLIDQVMPEIYLPYTITGFSNRLVTLTQGAPENVTKAILNQVYSIDKEQPVTDIATIDQILHDGVFAEARFNFLLLTIFAYLGLILSSIGLYGVMSYSVARRIHELGLRIALGAQRRDILKLILKQGLILTLIGISIGLVISLALTRYLSTLLFSISPTDPPTFIIIALLLLFVASLACLIPARWAIKVDPMIALRSE